MPREPVARGEPRPDAGPPGGRAVAVGPTPEIRPAMPEADYIEVAAASPGRGVGGAIWSAAKWAGREAVMPALEKLIPQGAAEVTQALFTGNGYVPYGPTERPVPMEEDAVGVHGRAQDAGPADPNYPQVSEYEAAIAAYAQRGRGMDNDHSRSR